MDKNQLLQTAVNLPKVSEAAYKEYQQKSELIINAINEKMLVRSDIDILVGENNFSMMKDNHSNHVRFIASLLQNYNPEVFVDTVLWVFRAYRTHGFKSNYWAAQLNAFIEILKEILSEQNFKEIYFYYEWMQINIPTFVKLSDEKIENLNSLH